jgi:hypothetical protein
VLSFLHKSHLSSPYMPYCIGCCQWVHFHCLCLLVKHTRKLKILTNYNTTKALSSIFNASKGISTIFASEETFLNRHRVWIKLVLLPNQSPAIDSLRIAAHRLIICNCGVVHCWKGRVLIHRDYICASTFLGCVSGARVVAIAFSDLHTID